MEEAIRNLAIPLWIIVALSAWTAIMAERTWRELRKQNKR